MCHLSLFCVCVYISKCVCLTQRERFNDPSVIACWNDTVRNGSQLGQSGLVAFIKINKSASGLKERERVFVCVHTLVRVSDWYRFVVFLLVLMVILDSLSGP